LITVEAAPSKPTINTSIAGMLSTQAAQRYQWYRDGILLPDDTLQSYFVAQSGFHQVRVWNTAGCSEISDSTGAFIELDEKEVGEISISPNPSKGLFIFDLSNVSMSYEIMIYGVSGQAVYTGLIEAGKKASVDLSEHAAGSYTAVLQSDNGMVITRSLVIID
jgi:WD40 repeat protein